MKEGSQPVVLPEKVLELFPEKTIGHYAITGVIGEGGQGVVLQLENEDGVLHTGKVVQRRFSLSPYIESLQGLRRAIDISKHLDHAGIQKVEEVVEDPEKNLFVVVKKYAEGRSLREMLDSSPTHTLVIEQLEGILDKTLDALQYLHTAAAHPSLPEPIYHRDIKPENIIVADDGNVTLIDLDTAKANTKTTRMTVAGTKIYAAPEALLGSNDARSDLYSLGFVAVEALLGEIPEELSDSRLPYCPAYTLPEVIPEKFRKIVDRMLHQDPAQRWQSAGDVRSALGKSLEAEIVVQDDLAELKRSYEVSKKGLRYHNIMRPLGSLYTLVPFSFAGISYYSGELIMGRIFGLVGLVLVAVTQGMVHFALKQEKKEQKLLEDKIQALEQKNYRFEDYGSEKVLEGIVEENSPERIDFIKLKKQYQLSKHTHNLFRKNMYGLSILFTAVGVSVLYNEGITDPNGWAVLGLVPLVEGFYYALTKKTRFKTKILKDQINVLEGKEERAVPQSIDFIIRHLPQSLRLELDSTYNLKYEELAHIAHTDLAVNPLLFYKSIEPLLLSHDVEVQRLAENLKQSYDQKGNFRDTYLYKIGAVSLGDYSIYKREIKRLEALETLCEKNIVWINSEGLVVMSYLSDISIHDPSAKVKKLAQEMFQSFQKDRDFSYTQPFIRRVINDYATTIFSIPITNVDEHMHVVMRDRYKKYIVDRQLTPAETFADYQANVAEHERAKAEFVKQFPDNPVYLRTIERQREIQEGPTQVDNIESKRLSSVLGSPTKLP